MLLGAIIGAGLPLEVLRQELGKLDLDGYFIHENSVNKNGVSATHITVDTSIYSSTHKSHTIEEFLRMIDESTLSVEVKNKTSNILRIIATAESKVHGEDHELAELGSIDTIIDVVGVVVGLDFLGLTKIYASPLRLGSGFVNTLEGRLPVPVPAVLAILCDSNALMIPSGTTNKDYGEMTTPTGAAILASLASFDKPVFTLQTTSFGAGNKDFDDIPNVIGLWIGEIESDIEIGEVSLLETNIDDMTPEILGDLQDKLFQKGALDVWFAPINMKKNRLGVSLNVICKPELSAYLSKFMLLNTSTLGIRFQLIKRYQADRELISIDTSIGNARVKVKFVDDTIVGVSPEFEDCKRISEIIDLPLSDVYRIVEQDGREYLGII